MYLSALAAETVIGADWPNFKGMAPPMLPIGVTTDPKTGQPVFNVPPPQPQTITRQQWVDFGGRSGGEMRTITVPNPAYQPPQYVTDVLGRKPIPGLRNVSPVYGPDQWKSYIIGWNFDNPLTNERNFVFSEQGALGKVAGGNLVFLRPNAKPLSTNVNGPYNDGPPYMIGVGYTTGIVFGLNPFDVSYRTAEKKESSGSFGKEVLPVVAIVVGAPLLAAGITAVVGAGAAAGAAGGTAAATGGTAAASGTAVAVGGTAAAAVPTAATLTTAAAGAGGTATAASAGGIAAAIGAVKAALPILSAGMSVKQAYDKYTEAKAAAKTADEKAAAFAAANRATDAAIQSAYADEYRKQASTYAQYAGISAGDWRLWAVVAAVGVGAVLIGGKKERTRRRYVYR